MKKLHVKKLTESAHPPERACAGDLGYDLFSAETVTIPSGGIGKIDTGIAVQFPEGYGGIIKDRSSIALKGLTVAAGVIDNGYRGEIVIILNNRSKVDFVVEQGIKIAQMIPVKVVKWEIEVADELSDSVRGEGGFGSTGDRKP